MAGTENIRQISEQKHGYSGEFLCYNAFITMRKRRLGIGWVFLIF